MARYRKPDGTVYDDRYEGPAALPRPASGAPQNIVEPITTATVEKQRAEAATNPIAPSAPISVGQAPTGSGTYSYKRSSSGRWNAPAARPFSPSDDTLDYQAQLKDREADRPGPFESRYEPAIQSILDGILNRKPFNAAQDANYQLLYNQARESYMNNGNRAMRDAMGAMQAQTGGYGSTAAQIAGSQAYDSYLQGLNDQNAQLMQMAYGMYQDEMADRYNQLGAVQGLDNTDYGRYRDDVSDYYRDLDYLANRYDAGYGRDFGTYTDARNYAYQEAMDRMSQENWEEQFAYQQAQDALAQQNWREQFDYQKQQDEYARQQALARMAGGGGGGGGSRRSSGGSSDGNQAGTTNDDIETINYTDVLHMLNNGESYDTVKAAISAAEKFYKSTAFADSNSKSAAEQALKMLKDLTDKNEARKYRWQ